MPARAWGFESPLRHPNVCSTSPEAHEDSFSILCRDAHAAFTVRSSDDVSEPACIIGKQHSGTERVLHGAPPLPHEVRVRRI